MRKVWKLPNLTHCNLLPVITNCLPLNIISEKRLLKFIWSIINSKNRIVNDRRYVLGKNFRYLAFKYKIKCSYIQICHILIVVFPILYQTVIIKMYL